MHDKLFASILWRLYLGARTISTDLGRKHPRYPVAPCGALSRVSSRRADVRGGKTRNQIDPILLVGKSGRVQITGGRREGDLRVVEFGPARIPENVGRGGEVHRERELPWVHGKEAPTGIGAEGLRKRAEILAGRPVGIGASTRISHVAF
jgi:hypothetical protein